MKNKLEKKAYRAIQDACIRCYDPRYHAYSRYGGRGIIVCDQWKKDWKQFIDWSLKNGIKEGLQLDRIDNDGNYEPSNCRWVTAKENANNTSKITFVELFGEIKTSTEWILDERIEISNRGYSERIKKGMSPKDALLTPRSKNKKVFEAWGEVKTIREWFNDDRCRLDKFTTLRARLWRGVNPEEAISTPYISHRERDWSNAGRKSGNNV